MPLTIAMRQAPTVWKSDSIHDTTAPILVDVARVAAWSRVGIRVVKLCDELEELGSRLMGGWNTCEVCRRRWIC